MTKTECEFEIAELLEEAKEQERFEKFLQSIPSMHERVKTKEAHLPLLYKLSNGFGSRVGVCPNCQSVLHYEYNQSFCGKCGQKVKWE